jgi:PKHD-type hydroxylase
MNLQNYYYYFQSALTPRTCDEIIEYGKRHKPEIAVTGGAEKNDQNIKKDGSFKKSALKKLHVKRKSDIVWMNDAWLYKEIHPYVREANTKAGWNFDWDWSESCQFTRYGVGQYYGWHCDSWDRPYVRKQKDWEQDKKKAIHECTEIRPRGSIIVFPSFVWHRVAPVTKGTRYSLVVWNLGEPWR